MTVAQFAIAYPEALTVFTKYNIDYCCHGQQTLEEACSRIGLDADNVRVEILQSTPGDPNFNIHPENWRSSFLIDFIIENHHTYIRNAVPELTTLLEKVCERHGSENPELREVQETFSELSHELLNHMEKEENVLFPAIKRLESMNSDSDPLRKVVQAPIGAMEEEHELAGALVSKIRLLSNNYSPPDYACLTFQITYAKLKDFEMDLIRHVHIENNILFQRFKPAIDATQVIS